MKKKYWIHLDGEGFIGYCKTYEEAERRCREFLQACGDDFSLRDANGGLHILALAGESFVEETRYRKDYMKYEEGMSEEEYEEACEEYGCPDPDCLEYSVVGMKRNLVTSPLETFEKLEKDYKTLCDRIFTTIRDFNLDDYAGGYEYNFLFAMNDINSDLESMRTGREIE